MFKITKKKYKHLKKKEDIRVGDYYEIQATGELCQVCYDYYEDVYYAVGVNGKLLDAYWGSKGGVPFNKLGKVKIYSEGEIEVSRTDKEIEVEIKENTNYTLKEADIIRVEGYRKIESSGLKERVEGECKLLKDKEGNYSYINTVTKERGYIMREKEGCVGYTTKVKEEEEVLEYFKKLLIEDIQIKVIPKEAVTYRIKKKETRGVKGVFYLSKRR